MQREIFDKAGMSDSSYGFKPGNANVAATYAAGARGAIQPSEQVNALGTGGLTTTAVDLCMFSRALMEGKLLSPRSMKDLQSRTAGTPGRRLQPRARGTWLGYRAEPEFAARGVTVLGKDGFTTVFRSQMFIAPKQNVAAVTILAGPASLPGDVVIGIGQRLMAAALEDSGRMPPPSARNSIDTVNRGIDSRAPPAVRGHLRRHGAFDHSTDLRPEGEYAEDGEARRRPIRGRGCASISRRRALLRRRTTWATRSRAARTVATSCGNTPRFRAGWSRLRRV